MAGPTTVHLASGNEILVAVSTVKEALGLFVKENWMTPLPSIRTPVKLGGVPINPCVMEIVWPSKLI